MLNLKKMLLISISILATSCAPGVPDAPEALKVIPVWQEDQIVHFRGKYMKSGERVSMTLPQAKEAVLVCSDVETETAYAKYVKDLQELAKKRCK